MVKTYVICTSSHIIHERKQQFQAGVLHVSLHFKVAHTLRRIHRLGKYGSEGNLSRGNGQVYLGQKVDESFK